MTDTLTTVTVLPKPLTTEPKPALTADEKRAATGPVIVALNLHRYLIRPAIDKARVLGDVAYLQTALVNWTDDWTLVGGLLKQVVVGVIAEAATDKRLTPTKK